MEEPLVCSIHSNLSLGLYENARFLGERLVAACPTEQNKYLLATCYRHCNQGYRAVHLLKGSTSPNSRYLSALCCIELKQYREAEELLLKHGEAQVPAGAAGWYLLGRISRLTGSASRAADCYVRALRLDPLLWVAFAELCTLGQPDKTAEFCDERQLSVLGQALTAQQQQASIQQQYPALQQQPPQQPGQQQLHQPGMQQHEQQQQHLVQQTPGVSSGMQAMSIDGATPAVLDTDTAARHDDRTPSGPGAFAAGHTPHMLTFVTPSPVAAPAAPPAVPHKGGLFPGFPEPPAGNRTPTLGKQKAPVGGGAAVGAAALGAGGATAAGKGGGRGRKASKAAGRLFANDHGPTASPRRSARLAASQTDAATPMHSDNRSSTPTPLGRQDPNQMRFSPVTGRGRQRQHQPQQHWRTSSAAAAPPAAENTPAGIAGGAAAAANGPKCNQQPELKPQQQHEQLLSLLLPLRRAVHLLSQYKCREALAALAQLPQQQLSSAGVLLLIGRCHYELVDYARAADAFEAARAADSLNLEGMELYSTVLWHLKRDVELAHLAQHALSVDRLAAESWCIAGNCFSLQREHDSAVRLFQRALQLAPHMAYAATLLGHEHLAGEDISAAATAYQHALRCDSRHYNALYGLGQLYMKQEKCQEALTHFLMASKINPSSSVLRCCCGSALHKMGQLQDALRQLKCAIGIDRRNPLARFEAAAVLVALDRIEDALAELKQLQEIVPREPSVHFMMGRLYKRLQQPDKALSAFNTALDLKPSTADRTAVKAAIDKVYMAEDDEDEEL